MAPSSDKVNIKNIIEMYKNYMSMDDRQLAILEEAYKECDSITDPDSCEFAAKHKLCVKTTSNRMGL